MKKTIQTYVLTFICCIFLIIGLPSAYFSTNAFSSDNYIKEMQENGYSEAVLDGIYKRFDNFGDEITFDTDFMFDLINKEEVVKHSEKYAKAYLDAILNGNDFSNKTTPKYDISYTKEDIKNELLKFYETQEGEFSEKELDLIYKRIEDELNSAMKFLPQNIMDKTVPLGRYVVLIKKALNIAKLAIIPALIALLGIVLINRKSGIAKIIYNSSAAVFISSAILFIPFFLFANYNVGQKIVLIKSPLSVVFSSVINVLFDGFALLSGVIFLISLMGIIVGAILTVLNLNKKTEEALVKATAPEETAETAQDTTSPENTEDIQNDKENN